MRAMLEEILYMVMDDGVLRTVHGLSLAVNRHLDSCEVPVGEVRAVLREMYGFGKVVCEVEPITYVVRYGLPS